ncbi:MAG: NADH-quinone oxidoreductase subunit K [Candidatus Bathyarchaeia archaeon]
MIVNLTQLYLISGFLLMMIGIYCIMAKRNMIKTIIGIEIITSGINLNFIGFGYRQGVVDSLAQAIVITSIVIGACIAGVGLSILINAYRHYGTLDLKKLSRLKW